MRNLLGTASKHYHTVLTDEMKDIFGSKTKDGTMVRFHELADELKEKANKTLEIPGSDFE